MATPITSRLSPWLTLMQRAEEERQEVRRRRSSELGREKEETGKKCCREREREQCVMGTLKCGLHFDLEIHTHQHPRDSALFTLPPQNGRLLSRTSLQEAALVHGGEGSQLVADHQGLGLDTAKVLRAGGGGDVMSEMKWSY